MGGNPNANNYQINIECNSLGYKELVDIIKIERNFSSQIVGLKFKVIVDKSIMQNTKSLSATLESGNEYIVVSDIKHTMFGMPDDPLDGISGELIEIVDKNVRRFIANTSGVLILLWLLMQSLRIFYPNIITWIDTLSKK